MALQDLEQERLRIDEAGQPDMLHIVGQVRLRGEVGTDCVVIFQPLVFETLEVILFQDVKLGPA